PEIAIAGTAQFDGDGLISARLPFTTSGRALTTGDPTGFVRITADQRTDAIVGAQIVGPHASELISEAVLAIEMAATPVDLWASIHPHPTLAEALADAAHRLTS
ncbi:MAG: dihydrolipoyl dehydrogenase, partial [Mycetocola sp.]